MPSSLAFAEEVDVKIPQEASNASVKVDIKILRPVHQDAKVLF